MTCRFFSLERNEKTPAAIKSAGAFCFAITVDRIFQLKLQLMPSTAFSEQNSFVFSFHSRRK